MVFLFGLRQCSTQSSHFLSTNHLNGQPTVSIRVNLAYDNKKLEMIIKNYHSWTDPARWSSVQQSLQPADYPQPTLTKPLGTLRETRRSKICQKLVGLNFPFLQLDSESTADAESESNAIHFYFN